jgi:hypothetical protein
MTGCREGKKERKRMGLERDFPRRRGGNFQGGKGV